MKTPNLIRTVAALTADTFRQSLSHGIFWILLGITLVCVLICLSAQITGATNLAAPGETPEFLPPTDPDAQDPEKLQGSGVQVVSGQFKLAFGAISVPIARDARSTVHGLELALAGGVADTLGVLLALMWTAGFLPSFLDVSSIAVLLAKPTPRWALLLGKYLGVLAFVLFHGTLFVLGTWLALGLRTNVWDTAYLASAPLFLLHFAIFFGFSAFLAVTLRSTVVCVFGSIAFWCLCWGMNFGRHALVAEVHQSSDSVFSSFLTKTVEACYWILPKPADLGMLLYRLLDAGSDLGQPAAFTAVIKQGAFHPVLSVAASLAFTGVLLYAATRQFETADY